MAVRLPSCVASEADRAATRVLLLIARRHRATFFHSREVRRLAVELGRHLGFGAEELARLRRTALVHDVGKVLDKEIIRLIDLPWKLTKEEAAHIAKHPELGRTFLENRYGETLKHTWEGVLRHHSPSSASPRPSLEARILRVADVVTAVLDPRRNYREPATLEEVTDLIRRGMACGDLDADVAQKLLRLMADEKWRRRHLPSALRRTKDRFPPIDTFHVVAG